MSEERISVTVGQAAEMTGLTKNRIYELRREGRLEVRYPYRGGRNFLILVDSLRACIRSLPDEPPDS